MRLLDSMTFIMSCGEVQKKFIALFTLGPLLAEKCLAGVLPAIRTGEIMLSVTVGQNHAAAQHGVLLCC
jgi:hypothetical protein